MKIQAKAALATFRSLCEAMDSSRRVFFTRFGDGDLYFIAGTGTNSTQTANKQLSKEMREAWLIQDPHYFKGLVVNYPKDKGMITGVLAPFPQNKELEEIIIDTLGEEAQDPFENPVVFHYLALFQPELMVNFLDKYVRPRPKMFIGSTPRRVAEYIYGPIDYYIPIPARNSYDNMEEWYPQVLEHLPKVEVVLPTAGAASKVLQKRLWESGADVHSLDIGSLVDAVQLKGTRRWVRLLGHRSRKVLLPGWEKSGLFSINRPHEWKQELKYRFHLLMRR